MFNFLVIDFRTHAIVFILEQDPTLEFAAPTRHWRAIARLSAFGRELAQGEHKACHQLCSCLNQRYVAVAV